MLQSFASVILSVILSVMGLSTPVSHTEPAPVAPATFNAYYLGSASLWATESLSSVGIELPADTLILFSNEGNCGATGESHMGGCTTTFEDGSHLIHISPELKYTAWGDHILYHEYAHTLGYGECGAEAYAHVLEGNANLWSYPECEELL